MDKRTTRKSPFWEGIKASFMPALKGVVTGAFIGAVVGVATATIFGLVSVATGNGWDGLFESAAEAGEKSKGFFSEMNGFTSFKVQMFFNAVIVAGIDGVAAIRNSFGTAYNAAKEHNQTLDIIEGRSTGLVVAAQQHMAVAHEAPVLSKGIQEIIERGQADSHHEMAERMAQEAVGDHHTRH